MRSPRYIVSHIAGETVACLLAVIVPVLLVVGAFALAAWAFPVVPGR